MSLLYNKMNGKGVGRIYKAMYCSFAGFKCAWVHESAFRQEVVLAIVLFPFSFFLATSVVEWVILVSALIFVVMCEVINSAIENLADAITIENHEFIKRAKDLGSSAVFLSLTLLSVVWGAFIVARFFF